MSTPSLRQDSEPQSHPDDKQDRAENQMDTHTPSRWEANKRDVQNEERIRNGPLPSDGVAGEPLEEPSWIPNPVKAQFPDDLKPIRLTEPESYAAGVAAVIRTTEHLSMNRSFARGARSLMVLNHSHGIDCMSCAWPEPDGHGALSSSAKTARRLWHGRPTHGSVGWSSSRSIRSKSYRTKMSFGWVSREGRLSPWF